MRPVLSRFLQSSSSFGRTSSSPHTCARERMRERKVFSHERARSSRPLALRFFHPFFLLLSPFIERLPLGPLRPSCSCLFSFLRRSPSLTFSAVLSLTSLSSVSFIFLLSLGGGASSFSVVLVFRVVLFLFLRPLILPRVALFPSEFTPERVFLPLGRPPPLYASRSPFSSSFFVPVDRGVLHSSNLNAGRAGVLYRLRK